MTQAHPTVSTPAQALSTTRPKRLPLTSPQPRMETRAHEHSPLVSVITPAHDVLPYLGQALDVLAQTHRGLEVIVVDNGSTGGSGEPCDGCARRDGRLTVTHQENRGLSAPRNVGIDGRRASRPCSWAATRRSDCAVPA